MRYFHIVAAIRTGIDKQGQGISGKGSRRRGQGFAYGAAALALTGVLAASPLLWAQTSVTVDPDALEGLAAPGNVPKNSQIILKPPGSSPNNSPVTTPAPVAPSLTPPAPRVVETPPAPVVAAPVAPPAPSSPVAVDNNALDQLAPRQTTTPSSAVTLRRPGEIRPEPAPAASSDATVTVDNDALNGLGPSRPSASGSAITLRRPGDVRPDAVIGSPPPAPRGRMETVAVDAGALDLLGPAPRSGGLSLRAPRPTVGADTTAVAIDQAALDSLGAPPRVTAVALREPRPNSLFESPKSAAGNRGPSPNRQSAAAVRLASVNSAARTGVTVDGSALERLEATDGGDMAPVTLRPPRGAATPQPTPLPQVAAIVPPRPTLTPVPPAAPPRPAPEATPIPVPAPVTATIAPPPRPSIAPPPVPQTAPASLPPQQPPSRPAITAPEAPVAHVPGASTVLFEKGSRELSQAGRGELDALIGRARAGNGRIEIRGFANADSEASAARRLSLDRATTVRTYLAARGIDIGRMDVRPLGSQANDPAPADRVEIVLRDR